MEIAGPEQARASLNMGLTSGRAMVFARLARGIEPNSLYLLRLEEAVWVASEPLDEADNWQEVPPDSWVMIDSTGEVEITPIPDLPPHQMWK
jgi:predicted glutamine amidotransferase